MNSPLKILAVLSVAAVLAVIVVLVSFALSGAGADHGLIRYFSRLGIEVDPTAIIIAVGLIPVVWLVGFIIRTWSVK